MTANHYEITDGELARARSYAANEPWNLPRVLSQTESILRRAPHGELVIVTAPSIAPGVQVAVPEDWFVIYAAGPPRSVRILLVACVMSLWGTFKIQTNQLDDPMNTAGQVIEMALDLLAGSAFGEMIKMLRNQQEQQSSSDDE